MDVEAGVQVVNAFIMKWLDERDGYTEEKYLDDLEDNGMETLFFFGALPVGDDTIRFLFYWGRNVDVAKAQPEKRAEETIEALKKAHPEVTKFTFDVIVEQSDD